MEKLYTFGAVLLLTAIVHAAPSTRMDNKCYIEKKDIRLTYEVVNGTNCEVYTVSLDDGTGVTRDCNNGDKLSRNGESGDTENGRGKKLGKLIRGKRMAGSTRKDRAGDKQNGKDKRNEKGNKKNKDVTIDMIDEMLFSTTETPTRFVFDLESCSCIPESQSTTGSCMN